MTLQLVLLATALMTTVAALVAFGARRRLASFSGCVCDWGH
jgi:hypothetical protein